MIVEWLPLVFTAGWGSGVNAYAVVLVLSLLGRYADVAAIPDVLASPPVLIAAAVLFGVELVADKVPYVDSLWDAGHTVVRPAVGGALGLMLTGDASTWQQALAVSTGGTVALLSHLAKASLRLAVNTSPEPASNVAVSAAEDLSVAGVLSLILISPWVAAAVAAVLLLAALVLTFYVWRLVRRGWRRLRRRSERGPGAPLWGAPPA